MILDSQEQSIFSTEWKQRGRLLRRDVSSGVLSQFPSDGSDHVRFYTVDADRFLTAGHAPERNFLKLTVRRFDDPGTTLWSLKIKPQNQTCSGDPAAASGIRLHHLANFNNGGRWDNYLVTVNSDCTTATLGALPWFNGEAYEFGYQEPSDVAALPGTDLVMVSVARSSTIVVHDPVKGHEVTRFGLAERGGSPELNIVESELWTIDYDTFVRVDLKTLHVVQSLKIQSPISGTPAWSAEGMRQFAGELFVWSTRHRAAIARPFSGDVVIVDPAKCIIESIVPLAGQPLSCVVTKDGHVVARDWQSGDWTEGKVQ